jgi:uncharacterized protein (TIGR03437 family)
LQEEIEMRFVFRTALMIGLAAAASADVVIVQDSGGTNPNTLGFAGAFGGTAPGTLMNGAWNISGGPWNTNYDIRNLTSADISNLTSAATWTLTATFANLSTNTSPTYPGAPASCGSEVSVSVGGLRFTLNLCADGQGNQVLTLDPFTGSPNYTIKGLGTGSVTLSLIFNNTTHTADAYVNGIDMIKGFLGGSEYTGTFLLFGGENGSFTNVELSYATPAPTGPTVSVVANAEGESPTIAPNTWVEIKGSNLAKTGDMRTWQGSDFVNNQMPTQLDGVSATVNGKSAYVWYISPAQVNILTPPDAMQGSVNVVLTNNGVASAAFAAQAQTLSTSFFVFDATHIAATHLNGSYIGPTTLYPGSTTPALPGETVVIFANGFGATSIPVVSGSSAQSGTLATLPVIMIGGVQAMVLYAGLVAPGEYQFNVVVPATLANGDQPITATYNGATTQAGTVLTVHN